MRKLNLRKIGNRRNGKGNRRRERRSWRLNRIKGNYRSDSSYKNEIDGEDDRNLI